MMNLHLLIDVRPTSLKWQPVLQSYVTFQDSNWRIYKFFTNYNQFTKLQSFQEAYKQDT